MVDVLVQTPNLDVFGGPTSLEVSTDFGKPGIRGPIFWVGSGLPDVVLSPSQKAQVNINDFFINNGNVNSVDYSWLYKRVQSIGGEGAVWEEVLRLNQQQYSTKDLVPFEDGVGELEILLTDITQDNSSAVGFLDRFIIRNSFENAAANPVASSFTYSIITGSDSKKYLKIIFKAVVFNGTAWSNLESSHNVHTFVSYLV
jgi:hypothetical protein